MAIVTIAVTIFIVIIFTYHRVHCPLCIEHIKSLICNIILTHLLVQL